MSVYPDKKGGKLTGWFRVEVGLPGGGRLRARCKTMNGEDGAIAKEKEFKLSRVALPTTDAQGQPQETLKSAIDRLAPQLWKGKATADRMLHVAKECVRIAGDITLENLGSDPKVTKDASGVAWVDRLINELEEMELEGSSMNRYFAPISKVFTTLKDRREMTWTPRLKRQPENEGRLRFFTDAEEATLLSLLRPMTAAFVQLALLTGCRRSELYGIKEGTSVIEGNLLRIRKSKTAAGRRTIPLGAKAKACIAELAKLGYPTVWQLHDDWEKARETMGLLGDPEFVFYVCRHTCATRLLRSGVGIATVKSWLGHTNIKTTLRYAKVVPDMLDDAAAALERWGEGVSPTDKVTPVVPSETKGIAA